MDKTTLSIPKISCGHCVMSIKNELEDIQGVKKVEGSAEAKTITVEWENPADIDMIKNALKDIEYPAAD